MTGVVYAFPWNAPRSAIASPYLTYDQQYRRDRMFAALLHARKVLSLQPECVRFDVYRTAAVLEQNQGSQRANAFLISFCKKALPRLELVAKKYECAGINSNVSGAVLMNPLMILVKIIKLRWIHILSYDQMVSRKINNQTTRCANSIFYTTLFTNSAPNYT
ncbi:hypothetical protein DOE58_03090 [Salmonella enterica subsp. enterica serovar Brandenburg]|nr:hypothetical protein DOE58_03090 [Salmonella enterica subsp. enterica serovar Brandenburg]